MENQIIILPAEVKELAQKVSEKKQAEINTVLTQIFTGTDDWQKQVDAIEVKGIEDKMSIGLADVARKNAKNARIAAEKIFDAKREQVQQAKSEYDLEDKLWLKAKQVMQITFKAIEDKAEWKANFVKRYESEQKELRTQNRILEVTPFSQINRIEFENMSDEVFSSFLSGLQSAHEVKIAEAKRIEEEKIERERIEAERIEAQRIENIRLKEEADKREREIEKERKAHEQKLAKEREESERIQKIRSKREKQLQPYIVFIREYSKLINKDEKEYQAEFIEIKKGAENHWEFEKNERIKQQNQQQEQEKK